LEFSGREIEEQDERDSRRLDAAIGRAHGGCRSVYYREEHTTGESDAS
jgi:hypothetical protein